jgi:hypothetical protein
MALHLVVRGSLNIHMKDLITFCRYKNLSGTVIFWVIGKYQKGPLKRSKLKR